MGRYTIDLLCFAMLPFCRCRASQCVFTKVVSVHSLRSFIPSLNHSFLCLFVRLLVHAFHLLSRSLGCKVLSSSLLKVLLWHRLNYCSLITAICGACLARGISAFWNAASAVLITNDTKRRFYKLWPANRSDCSWQSHSSSAWCHSLVST